MKYLVAVPMLMSGSGLSQYIFSLCKLLCKDNDVYVVLTHNSLDTSFEKAEFRKISQDIKLVTLGCEHKFLRYLKVIKLIRKIKPDIIVNNYNAVIQYILPFIPINIKYVHVLHSDDSRFYRIAAINGRLISGWIAPTKAVAENFNKYTHNKFSDRITVIPHGVKSIVKPTKKLNRPIEVIYTGVLYEHKGVKTLPTTIKQLKENNIEFHFTIVGDGDQRDWLAEQFKSEISSGIVEMTGVINHEEVYKRMADADVFLYPTRLDSFGLVIAEAMMNGAVPVVTNLPGITDNLIRDKFDGYLIEKNDINGFSSTIIKLATDKGLLAKMSDAAYQRATAALSIEQMETNYINYFCSL